MLIPKRLMNLVVPDELVPKLIETVIKINRTGNRGDGKIIVLPIEEAVRVRTNERGAAALA
jgi:nitrogen regulatory protein PII 2